MEHDPFSLVLGKLLKRDSGPDPDPDEPTIRYIVSEDHADDIILSGDDDGVFLDYWEPEEPELRYVVTENGHDYDIGVSGYGDSVLLNYNED